MTYNVLSATLNHAEPTQSSVLGQKCSREYRTPSLLSVGSCEYMKDSEDFQISQQGPTCARMLGDIIICYVY